MKQYAHIFFDLDHTIWDFDKNAEEALHELYVIHSLQDIGLTSAEVFIETYTQNNHRLWRDSLSWRACRRVFVSTPRPRDYLLGASVADCHSVSRVPKFAGL